MIERVGHKERFTRVEREAQRTIEGSGDCEPAVSRETRDTRARDSRNNARRETDHAHAVRCFAHVHVARRVDCERNWHVERRSCRGPPVASARAHTTRPRENDDETAIHCAYDASVGLCNVDKSPEDVRDYCTRVEKPRRSRSDARAPEAGKANDAIAPDAAPSKYGDGRARCRHAQHVRDIPNTRGVCNVHAARKIRRNASRRGDKGRKKRTARH